MIVISMTISDIIVILSLWLMAEHKYAYENIYSSAVMLVSVFVLCLNYCTLLGMTNCKVHLLFYCRAGVARPKIESA
jgi:hypothetical protein